MTRDEIVSRMSEWMYPASQVDTLITHPAFVLFCELLESPDLQYDPESCCSAWHFFFEGWEYGLAWAGGVSP